MHSRIIQLSSYPIAPENRVTEFDLWPQIEHFADYIGEITNAEDYADSVDYAFGDNPDVFTIAQSDNTGYTITLDANSKANRFSERFNELKKLVSTMTLENFITTDNYVIKQLIEQEYEIYIYEYGECATLDNFIRFAEENKPYYVGAIYDYHY
jgi:hypothetical protein